jgi:hypothetical protein
MLKNDPDYTGALLQANPFHKDFLRQAFPTGEMFQPLAHFLLKVGTSAAASARCLCMVAVHTVATPPHAMSSFRTARMSFPSPA